ncbi:acetolactate decarboxylase [Methanococcoides burtonii]|uniref:Alpha-acetolactate decarboxylase n=1 Tax=Methanococcoides burtonii (strain DSM 6242 / NBRC 107633 / OCM 468 / ACE-M) TaxID=259564 RepID=Q12X73_METBU|nr:acetolactate decarboxylase [Methanococcoides burtonii]ABE51953.1 Alpha-acetolactate decarboxylase [Methanococcoides burtonii DSM 6242]
MAKRTLLMLSIILLTCSLLFSGCLGQNNNELNAVHTSMQNDVLYQVSTIDALLEGLYDGEVTIKELKEKGDTGLGTFNTLDGEMIMIDGEVYQIKTDGLAYLADDTMRTPFAAVTTFEADEAIVMQDTVNSSEVAFMLEQVLPSKNLMYAIRIDGNFSSMKVRSVPAQERPYPLLVDVVANEQAVFEHEDVEGSIVGFWLPYYVESMNVPGYHFHFIDSERTEGGHVLDYTLIDGTVSIDRTTGFELLLPGDDDFLSADLLRDKGEELSVVEKDD